MIAKLPATAAFLVITILGVPSHGAYIVYEFSGAFERAMFFDPVVPTGTQFSGLFSFPEERFARVQYYDWYEFLFKPVYVQLTVGNDTVVAPSARVIKADASAGVLTDSFALVAGPGIEAPFSGTIGGREINEMKLFLLGHRDTFSEYTIYFPASLAIDEFYSGSVHITSGPADARLKSVSLRDPTQGVVEFTMYPSRICETPTCAVPEPTVAAMAGSGAAAFALARWTGRSRKRRRTD